MTETRGRFAVVAAALLWSTGGVAIKLTSLGPLGVVFWRSLASAVFLLVALRPSLARLRKASPTTVLCYAAMIHTFVSATKLTTAANAILLQYTGPLYVVLFSPLLLGEPRRGRDLGALGLALIGMAIFFFDQLGSGRLAGDALGLVSGVFYGGTVLYLRRDRDRDAMASVTVGNLVAALAALPFATDALAPSARDLALTAYLGVVQMGVSYLLFAWGLRSVRAGEAAILGMLEPLLSPVWAFLGAGERPAMTTILGGSLVLGAVALPPLLALRGGAGAAQRSSRSPRPSTPENEKR